jgi:hypothetical protein
MTDQQLDDRFKVLANLVSAIDATNPLSHLAQEIAFVRKEIANLNQVTPDAALVRKELADLKAQLAKIERDVRTIKARQ